MSARSLTVQLGFKASQACGECLNLLCLCLNSQLLMGELRHGDDEGWSKARFGKRISAPGSCR